MLCVRIVGGKEGPEKRADDPEGHHDEANQGAGGAQKGAQRQNAAGRARHVRDGCDGRACGGSHLDQGAIREAQVDLV